MERNLTSDSPDKARQDTILIVEDEPLMLRLLEKFFSQRGYYILAAADGEQAVEIYHSYKSRIDAVLLDIRLPKATGEKVFRRLKEENAAVKVVMASGYLAPGIKSDLGLAGVKGFVDKPYQLDELVEVLRNVIKND
jgi:two-component system, cell cycle sensor histidine kinase and response regulator CckA